METESQTGTVLCNHSVYEPLTTASPPPLTGRTFAVSCTDETPVDPLIVSISRTITHTEKALLGGVSALQAVLFCKNVLTRHGGGLKGIVSTSPDKEMKPLAFPLWGGQI